MGAEPVGVGTDDAGTVVQPATSKAMHGTMRAGRMEQKLSDRTSWTVDEWAQSIVQFIDQPRVRDLYSPAMRAPGHQH